MCFLSLFMVQFTKKSGFLKTNISWYNFNVVCDRDGVKSV